MAEGPFTVFAPTNDAFNMLFEDLGVNGLDDLSAEDLTPILLYHVVPDNVLSTEVASGSVPTLNESSNIEVMVSDMGVKLNGMSNVIAVDVQGSNGVVHVIDKVILPQ
jgi:transforming growth factor-beta-induced protein